MHWNYRVVEYSDGSGFGLHEVFYNDDGQETSMTAEPIRFVADSVDELRSMIATARDDMLQRPVFKEPEDWDQ